MTRKPRGRAIALAAAAVAVVAGTGGAARALPGHQPLVTGTAHTPAGSAGCGSGGAGGRGGDSGEGGRPGQAGEPGKPGTHECTRSSDLPDKPKEKLTVADKVRVVLVLTNGGATEAQIAKKYMMPKHEVEVWKRAYLKGDWSVLLGTT
ncbi:hypothetical protein [Streptomyces sp. NPDC007905]|uniref:hypothetical protein n=1 Tax=Streptomyces sp. NPDC007905 TaxID=3364788 RepID=UPI0036F08069